MAIKDIVKSIFKGKTTTANNPEDNNPVWAKNMMGGVSSTDIAQKEGWTDATTNIIPILSPQQIRYFNALNQLSLYDALIYIREHSGKTEWKVYEDMMLDPNIDSAYQQRQSAVFKDDWDIVGDNVDDKIKTMVKEVIELCENFDDALRAAHKAVLRGYSALEINWQQWSKYIIPLQINEKHPAWFNFDSIGNPTYSTVATYPMYDPIPPEMSRKFIIHSHGVEAGDRRGKPILVRLYQTWFLKKHATMQWGTFISRYADPAWIVQSSNMFMPMPGDKKGRSVAEVLSEMFANLRQGDDIQLPADDKFNMQSVEPKSATASHDLFLKFIEALKENIILELTGQTLTTSTQGVGSYAMADVHYQVRADIAELDKVELETTLNRSLVPWICDLNGYAGLERYPEFRFKRPDRQDINTLATGQKMGAIITLGYLHSQLGVPLPDGVNPDDIATPETGTGSNPFSNTGTGQ